MTVQIYEPLGLAVMVARLKVDCGVALSGTDFLRAKMVNCFTQ